MKVRHDLLLVEDDPVTRELLSVLLSGEGWQVHAVETGEDAIAWLQACPATPDMVLCDQKLPGLCGAALARQLRATLNQSAAGTNTLLLGMTATVDGEAGVGYEGLLVKPFPVAAVETFWREATQRRKKAAPPADVPEAASSPARNASSSIAADQPPDRPPDRPGNDDNAPVLDEAVFLKLRQSMALPALRSLYEFTLADAGDRLRHMRDAITLADYARYTAEAHALKGSSGMVGAHRLHALAAEAESAGKRFAEAPRTEPAASTPTKLNFSVAHLDDIGDAIAQIRLMLETLFPM